MLADCFECRHYHGCTSRNERVRLVGFAALMGQFLPAPCVMFVERAWRGLDGVSDTVRTISPRPSVGLRG